MAKSQPDGGAVRRAEDTRRADNIASERVLQAVAPTTTKSAHPADLETMIGQMIIIGFLGDDAGDRPFTRVAEQLAAGEISGVLYLKRNIKNRASVGDMNAVLQISSPNGLPPLIVVDQEGGRVERLTSAVSFPHTPSAARVASSMSPREAYETYARMAANLSRWGFNVNLGPVVDLNTNRNNPIIGRLGRSFSGDSKTVIQYSVAFMDAHRENGVMTALKHFPGHGSSTGDTHKGTVDVSTSWSQKELEPYEVLIHDSDVDLVMSSHIRNSRVQDDSEKYPVSLSRSGLGDTLRKKLKYRGVIISDDLQMGAIANHYKFRDMVVRAVLAGNDLLVFANDKNPDPEIPGKVIKVLADASKEDETLRRRIRDSYLRIRKLKAKIEQARRNVADQTITRTVDVVSNGGTFVVTPEFVAGQVRDVKLVVPASSGP